MPTKWTSTLLWEDVLPDQRETPAGDAQAILSFARMGGLVGDAMVPWCRQHLARLQQAEMGQGCPIATRQMFDRKRRVWMYRPCANQPRPNGRCWRHQDGV